MTALNRVDLKAKFESGDTPQGSDYADLIDSFVNLVETTSQAMQGPLSFSGTVSAATYVGGGATFSGTVSAASVFITTMNTSTVSAQSVAVSVISAPTSGVVFNAHLNMVSGYFIKQAVVSVACSGSTQAQGTIISGPISILRTVATGVADSITLPGMYPGAIFTIINTTTGSARLFPPAGGTINALGANGELSIGGRDATTSRIIVWCDSSTQAYATRSP